METDTTLKQQTPRGTTIRHPRSSFSNKLRSESRCLRLEGWLVPGRASRPSFYFLSPCPAYLVGKVLRIAALMFTGKSA